MMNRQISKTQSVTGIPDSQTHRGLIHVVWFVPRIGLIAPFPKQAMETRRSLSEAGHGNTHLPQLLILESGIKRFLNLPFQSRRVSSSFHRGPVPIS